MVLSGVRAGSRKLLVPPGALREAPERPVSAHCGAQGPPEGAERLHLGAPGDRNEAPRAAKRLQKGPQRGLKRSKIGARERIIRKTRICKKPKKT